LVHFSRPPQIPRIYAEVSISPRGTIRIWFHPERGYLAEARTSPEAPPIYHYLSPKEADLVAMLQAPPELIDRLFTFEEAKME